MSDETRPTDGTATDESAAETEPATDESATETEPVADDAGWESAPDDAETEPPSDDGIDVDSVVTYLMWGALVGLGVLAAVATASLYGSLSGIIDVWIARRFQPFARAALNFAVLCAAAAGIVVLARRLRSE